MGDRLHRRRPRLPGGHGRPGRLRPGRARRPRPAGHDPVDLRRGGVHRHPRPGLGRPRGEGPAHHRPRLPDRLDHQVLHRPGGAGPGRARVGGYRRPSLPLPAGPAAAARADHRRPPAQPHLRPARRRAAVSPHPRRAALVRLHARLALLLQQHRLRHPRQADRTRQRYAPPARRAPPGARAHRGGGDGGHHLAGQPPGLRCRPVALGPDRGDRASARAPGDRVLDRRGHLRRLPGRYARADGDLSARHPAHGSRRAGSGARQGLGPAVSHPGHRRRRVRARRALRTRRRPAAGGRGGLRAPHRRHDGLLLVVPRRPGRRGRLLRLGQRADRRLPAPPDDGLRHAPDARRPRRRPRPPPRPIPWRGITSNRPRPMSAAMSPSRARSNCSLRPTACGFGWGR